MSATETKTKSLVEQIRELKSSAKESAKKAQVEKLQKDFEAYVDGFKKENKPKDYSQTKYVFPY